MGLLIEIFVSSQISKLNTIFFYTGPGLQEVGNHSFNKFLYTHYIYIYIMSIKEFIK